MRQVDVDLEASLVYSVPRQPEKPCLNKNRNQNKAEKILRATGCSGKAAHIAFTGERSVQQGVTHMKGFRVLYVEFRPPLCERWYSSRRNSFCGLPEKA